MVTPLRSTASYSMSRILSPKTLAYRADIEDLRKYTLQLLTDDKLREKMGKQARKHVLENLDYRHIAKQMVDITKDRLDLK